MLFVIEPEVVALAANHNNDAIRVLNDLFISVRYGFHSVFAEREVLASVRDNVGLNQDTRGMAKHILAHYAVKYGSVRDRIFTCIILNASNDHQVREQTGKRGQLEYVLPISMIKDNTLFQETELLLENTRERGLYMQMSRYYGSRIGYPFPSKLRSQMGGGDSTAGEFADRIEDRRICLCICDSDIKYPDDSLGVTAQKIFEKVDQFWPLCKVVSTSPFREIENLIPFPLLTLLPKKKINNDAIKDFDRVLSHNPQNYYYLDIKLGLNLWVWYTADNNYRNHLDAVLVGTGIKTEEELVHLRQLSEEQVKERKGDLIIHEAGSAVLDNYLEDFGPISITDKHLHSIQVAKWLELGKLLYEWGFSFGRLAG